MVSKVLVPCWILIELHHRRTHSTSAPVLVPCRILIELHENETFVGAVNVLVPCWILIELHEYGFPLAVFASGFFIFARYKITYAKSG